MPGAAPPRLPALPSSTPPDAPRLTVLPLPSTLQRLGGGSGRSTRRGNAAAGGGGVEGGGSAQQGHHDGAGCAP